MNRCRMPLILLCFILILGMLPAGAYAGETQPQEEGGQDPPAGQAGDGLCRITLPAGQKGYTVRAEGDTAVPPGGSFTFYVTIEEGYKKGAGFAVKVGDVVLKPVPAAKKEGADPAGQGQESSKEQPDQAETAEQKDGEAAPAPEAAEGTSGTDGAENKQAVKGKAGKYTISDITSDLTVTVIGVEKDPAAQEADPAAGGEEGAPAAEETAYGSENQEMPPENTGVNEEEQYPAGEGDGQMPDDEGFAEGNVYPEDNTYPGDGYTPSGEYDAQPDPGSADGAAPDMPAEESYDYSGENLYDDPGNMPEGGGAVPAMPVNEETIDGSYGNEEVTEGYYGNGEVTDGSYGNGEVADESFGDGQGAPGLTDGEPVEQNDEEESSSENSLNAGTDNPAAVRDIDSSDTGDTTAAADDTSTGAEKADEEYPLWICGVKVESDNCKDILGDGSAVYDPEQKILTLKKATLKSSQDLPAPVYYTGSDKLTIKFSGDCNITGADKKGGIVCRTGSLLLDGSGTLTVRTTNPSNEASIQCKSGDITVSGGTVTALCVGGKFGFRAVNIKIADGAEKVQASAESAAFYSDTEISIADGLGVTNPSGGAISKSKKSIADADEKTAKAAVIGILPVYKVTFIAAGGSGSMPSESVVKGKKLKLPECGFEAPQCKKFSGWMVNKKILKAGTSITVTSPVDVYATWADDHTLQKVPKKAPTCIEDGNIEYYRCTGCGKRFLDSDAKKQASDKDIIIKATGHRWGNPTYTWAEDYSSATAKRVCLNNSAHEEKETVSSGKSGKGPTCEEYGNYTYTAVFSNPAFKKQTKKVSEKPLGHIWGDPQFIWTQQDNGNYKVDARFTCKRDSSHKTTEKAEVKTTVTMPTKSADGKLSCTATVEMNDKTYTSKEEDAISPAGTSRYKFSSADNSWTRGSGKSLKFTIKRNAYDLITYNAFDHIQIDGKTVSKSDYSTEKGSLKLKLYTDLVNDLSEGTHTLLVEFKDGSVERDFRIKEKTYSSNKGSSSPSTGDSSSAALWLLIFAVCAAGAAALIALKKKHAQ